MSKVGRGSVQSYEKIYFSVYLAVWVFLPKFLGKLDEMIKVLLVVAYPIVFILFDDRYWQGGVPKRMKNYHFFSIFSRFGIFPKVFGRVNGWSILGMHKIIRVLHVVVCSFVFILFCSRD